MTTTAITAHVLGEAGFAEGTVLVEGNRITAVASSPVDQAALRSRAAEHIDAAGCWLIPGLIDVHAHGYATLLRGTENSMPLELWALYTVLYGGAYDAAAMRAAILLGAAERIRAGITGWIDHSPMVHLAEAALAAHAESGLRVCWAAFLHDISDYTLMDLKLPPAVARLAGGTPPFDADRYAQRFGEFVQAAKPDRVTVMLGPNAPQRCSPAAWALWRDLRDRHGVGVHTHLMETRVQAAIGARWPDGLVAEMERQGLLDSGLSVAHGIWLTQPERAVLARHGVTLAHNPASNLMLGSGILPLADVASGRPDGGARHRLRQYRRAARSVRGDAIGDDAAARVRTGIRGLAERARCAGHGDTAWRRGAWAARCLGPHCAGSARGPCAGAPRRGEHAGAGEHRSGAGAARQPGRCRFGYGGWTLADA